MKVGKVNLQEKYPFLRGGTLDCLSVEYPLDGEKNKEWKRPAVVVVPGGGYGYVSKREGEPIAMEFLSRGFQTFVLTYLVASDGVRYPEQLLELAAAVDYVKKNAEAFDVNPDEIFVVGFSAGGHLTGNLAIEYDDVSAKAGVSLDCKPTAVGLCYPVISQKDGHQGSYENLLQAYTDEAKEELLKTLNLNEAVSEKTPPAFLWATAEDNCVPVSNAIRYAEALAAQNIAFELHVYPCGLHGLSTAKAEVCSGVDNLRVQSWLDGCAKFFKMYVAEKI